MENLELELDPLPYKTPACIPGSSNFGGPSTPEFRLDAETAKNGGGGVLSPIVEMYDRPSYIVYDKGAGTGRRPFIRLDAETAKSDGSGWPCPWKSIQNYGGNGGRWPIVEKN